MRVTVPTLALLALAGGGIWWYGHTRYMTAVDHLQPAINALETQIDVAGEALKQCDAATTQAQDEADRQRARAVEAVNAAEESAHKAAALNAEWHHRLAEAKQDPACAEVLEMELCPAVMDY